MREPEVQPLAARVLGGGQVLVALGLAHGGPAFLAVGVAQHVVALDGDDEDDVPRDQAQQYLVAAPVQRGIVGLVDLGTVS